MGVDDPPFQFLLRVIEVPGFDFDCHDFTFDPDKPVLQWTKAISHPVEIITFLGMYVGESEVPAFEMDLRPSTV